MKKILPILFLFSAMTSSAYALTNIPSTNGTKLAIKKIVLFDDRVLDFKRDVDALHLFPCI